MNLFKELDLRKEQVLDLKKKVGLEGQKAQVVLALDYSGSMGMLYSDGSVQKLVERILPLGLAFDDNQEVDFYLFHDGQIRVDQTLNLNNIVGYIDNKVMNRYRMGGTNYAPVINAIVKDFGKKSGWFGSGKPSKLDLPVYVIFITDGENSDRGDAEQAIREAANHGIFFQFVGIGRSSFSFLEKLDNLSGRNIDNANFFKVENLNNKTDEQLYSLLLTEFPTFVTEARTKNLIA